MRFLANSVDWHVPWMAEPSGVRRKLAYAEVMNIYSSITTEILRVLHKRRDRQENWIEKTNGVSIERGGASQVGGVSLRTDRLGQWFARKAPDDRSLPNKNMAKKDTGAGDLKIPRCRKLSMTQNVLTGKRDSLIRELFIMGKPKRWVAIC